MVTRQSESTACSGALRVCAWCDKWLALGAPIAADAVARPRSHGICPRCLDERLARLDGAGAVGLAAAPAIQLG
jgi:hypothetical protein